MIDLLSIDAGVGKRTAHAVFRNGILTSCYTGLPPVILRWDLIVIERMQWRGVKSKENVADLLLVAELVGEYKKLYEMHGLTVELVWPTTWKGSVPKGIHQKRILSKLLPGERELIHRHPREKKSNSHVVDAIGIGLWKLGRL